MMNPDRWLLIWIDDGAGPPFVKVFATWAGGYTTGDSWRLNSGIDNVVSLDEDGWIVRGESGTHYRLHDRSYGIAGRSNHYVLQNLLEKFPNQISILTEDEARSWLDTKNNA